MAVSFPYFSKIPSQEVQEMIWKAAVRPHRPGVHIFWVYSWTEDEESHRGKVIETTGFRHDRSFPAFAAPACLPFGAPYTRARRQSARHKWAGYNPSTYLIDHGLRTACRQSRRVIQEVFNYHVWRKLHQAQRPLWNGNFPDPEFRAVAATLGRDSFPLGVTLTASDGFAVYSPSPEDAVMLYRQLTIFPNEDLILMQIEILDLERINYPVSAEAGRMKKYYDHAHHWRGCRDPRALCPGVNGNHYDCAREPEKMHHGIELEPQWSKRAWKNIVINKLYTLTLHDHTQKLWLVDYRIKQKNSAAYSMTEQEATEMRNSKVFYGSDRKYVEIPPARYPYGSEISVWCYDENAATPQDEDPSLNGVIKGIVRDVRADYRRLPPQEVIGLLACVPI